MDILPKTYNQILQVINKYLQAKSNECIQDPIDQKYFFALLQFSLDYESLTVLEVSSELTVGVLEKRIPFLDESLNVLLEKIDKRARNLLMK